MGGHTPSVPISPSAQTRLQSPLASTRAQRLRPHTAGVGELAGLAGSRLGAPSDACGGSPVGCLAGGLVGEPVAARPATVDGTRARGAAVSQAVSRGAAGQRPTSAVADSSVLPSLDSAQQSIGRFGWASDQGRSVFTKPVRRQCRGIVDEPLISPSNDTRTSPTRTPPSPARAAGRARGALCSEVGS